MIRKSRRPVNRIFKVIENGSAPQKRTAYIHLAAQPQYIPNTAPDSTGRAERAGWPLVQGQSGVPGNVTSHIFLKYQKNEKRKKKGCLFSLPSIIALSRLPVPRRHREGTERQVFGEVCRVQMR
jgi:hypothetical protein